MYISKDGTFTTSFLNSRIIAYSTNENELYPIIEEFLPIIGIFKDIKFTFDYYEREILNNGVKWDGFPFKNLKDLKTLKKKLLKNFQDNIYVYIQQIYVISKMYLDSYEEYNIINQLYPNLRLEDWDLFKTNIIRYMIFYGLHQHYYSYTQQYPAYTQQYPVKQIKFSNEFFKPNRNHMTFKNITAVFNELFNSRYCGISFASTYKRYGRKSYYMKTDIYKMDMVEFFSDDNFRDIIELFKI
jgi:hypothetical protein